MKLRWIQCPVCRGRRTGCISCGEEGRLVIAEPERDVPEWVWWAIFFVVVAGCCAMFIWGKP